MTVSPQYVVIIHICHIPEAEHWMTITCWIKFNTKNFNIFVHRQTDRQTDRHTDGRHIMQMFVSIIMQDQLLGEMLHCGEHLQNSDERYIVGLFAINVGLFNVNPVGFSACITFFWEVSIEL
jgi:hypothetical protein